MKLLRIQPLLLALIFLSGCYEHRLYTTRHTVIRVFINGPGTNYSFMEMDKDRVLHHITLSPVKENGEVKLVADVPNGEPMWAEVEWDDYAQCHIVTKAQIHIRSGADLEGGTFQFGKGGVGKTNVVE